MEAYLLAVYGIGFSISKALIKAKRSICGMFCLIGLKKAIVQRILKTRFAQLNEAVLRLLGLFESGLKNL
ncbi:hypothetical protein M0802_011324 [Mischocyttarus mexicanus]|nr:hypothetical protein M0802_011324 [Mischocyttarus mexicanus]